MITRNGYQIRSACEKISYVKWEVNPKRQFIHKFATHTHPANYFPFLEWGDNVFHFKVMHTMRQSFSISISISLLIYAYFGRFVKLMLCCMMCMLFDLNYRRAENVCIAERGEWTWAIFRKLYPIWQITLN